MNNIGPSLQQLTRRIAQTPADFLDEPRVGNKGRLEVAALAVDYMRQAGHVVDADTLPLFIGTNARKDRNRLQLIALAVWVLNDEWFSDENISKARLLLLLDDGMFQLAQSTSQDKCVNDAERREEFARMLLSRLDYRPQGETEAQATDRLSALSSTERARLLKESVAAEQRAREVREALARKAAQESADKWTRE